MAQQYLGHGLVGFDSISDSNIRRHRQPRVNYISKTRVTTKYHIIGFISSGTYGRVYKAVERDPNKLAYIDTTSPTSPVVPITPGTTKEIFAIKKFKPEKEGDNVQYTGLSQSAIREMSLCTELSHPNLIHLVEIILQEKCVFMVFEYCEHDLLQIIHHHTQPPRRAIPATMIKSILFQLLNGLHYLHENWVMHRDLKPANIMVTSNGAVRIGDLGLARRFDKPLASLYSGDKVVVTIWYRSPDLLLGAQHYTVSIDLWAVGCIFAELLSLRPIFKGEETKMDNKKTVPFQRHQMAKIVEILGMPDRDSWPGIVDMPAYYQLQQSSAPRAYQGMNMNTSVGSNPPQTGNPYSSMNFYSQSSMSSSAPVSSSSVPSVRLGSNISPSLESWYTSHLRSAAYPITPANATPGKLGLSFLQALFTYDPSKRPSAAQALQHEYFRNTDEGHPHKGEIWVSSNCFEGLSETYPARRVSTNDNDVNMSSLPGTKRGGLPDDSILGREAKRR